ncbi:MAG TPA: YjbQ family protein [Trueperaceae bacterium]|nr:YjbQ family protein [Trueperaceae bacterium]
MNRQYEIILPAMPRGFHLITREIISAIEIADYKTALLHLFIQHTSASLTINENASADVRRDFEQYFLRAVPDSSTYFEHTYEGLDDMPSHIKASILGNSLTIPITNGRLNLGTWQGIYLGEHRIAARSRKIIATILG